MIKERKAIRDVMCIVIANVLRWITSSGKEKAILEYSLEHAAMPGIYIIMNELIGIRNTGSVLNHIQVSAMGNPFKYPIDILEIVYQKADVDSGRSSGIYIHYKDGEFPLILADNTLTMNDKAVRTLIDLIIEDNKDLLKLIEHNAPGGKSAAKKSG